MADKGKPKLAVFTKTDYTPDEPEQAEDPVKSRGIGLRLSEWRRLDDVAGQVGMTPHALALWALRDFLRRWDAGEIETHTTRTLKQ